MKIISNQLNLNSNVNPNKVASSDIYSTQQTLYKLNSIIDTTRPRVLMLDGYDVLDEIKIAKLFDNTSKPVGVLTHYQGEKNYLITKGIVFDGGLIGNIGDIVYCTSDGFLTTSENNVFIGKIIDNKRVFINIGEENTINTNPTNLDSKNFIAGTNVLKIFGLNNKLLKVFNIFFYPGIKIINDGNAIIYFYQNRIDHILTSNKTQTPIIYSPSGDIRSVSYVNGKYFIFGNNKFCQVSTTGYDSYVSVTNLPNDIINIRHLAYSSSYKNRIFFMTTELLIPQICYSNDGGDTWNLLDVSYNIVGFIAHTLITANNIIITTGSPAATLWVSQNNTMIQIISFPQDTLVGLAYNGNVLMAVTDYGAIYVSYDEGLNWDYSSVTPLGQNVNRVTFLESLNLFVISAKDLSFFISQDGLKWTHIDNPTSSTPGPTRNIEFIDEPNGNIIVSFNDSFISVEDAVLHEIKKL